MQMIWKNTNLPFFVPRASHPDKVTEETNTQYLCNGCSKNFKTQVKYFVNASFDDTIFLTL